MDAKSRLDDPLRTAVGIAVNLLVNGEYGVLESLTNGRYLSAEQLRRAIEDYGRTLVTPPEAAFAELDIQTADMKPPTFHVVFPLWTREEGLSDLTFELRLIEAPPGGVFETEVVGLHVL